MDRENPIQSVKNTDTAENKGYDGGKKVSGIKRPIAVDTQGLPYAIYITTANVTDCDGAIAMASHSKENLSNVKVMLEVAKRYELHRFVVIAKRWVVERSFAWLEKCRRLWKNCERKINTSLQMVILAFIRLLIQRL